MHASITVNNQLLFSNTIEHWQQRLPDELAAAIQPDAMKNQPWMVTAMLALAEATKMNKNVHITVNTRPYGWAIAVDHEHA